MTIALDGSSPTSFDLTGDGSGGASGTSASFTPPANAWIYIHIALAVGTSRTPTYTPTNTGGGLSSWTLVDSLGSTGTQGGAVAVYRAFVNSSVATTVSVSLTGTGLALAAVCGHVYTDVRTGASASQTGAATIDGHSTTQNISPTLTTTATGSEVVGIFNDESANGNPTSTDTLNARTSASQSDARVYKASNSGAAGSVAVNANGAAGGTQWTYALYEILAPATGLAGNAAATAAATANVSTAIKLAGAPSTSSSATGLLAVERANAAATAAATAALLTAIKLAGAPTVSTGSNTTLGAAIALAAAGTAASAASATLTNWTSVTLVAPLYSGPGGILDPHLLWTVPPVAGTVVLYDGTYVTVAPNGELSSTISDCSAVVQYTDTSGNPEIGVISFTSGLAGFADVSQTAAAALATAIRLVGAGAALSNATAGLNAQITLRGAVSALTSAAASLVTQILAAAAAVEPTSASGTLSGTNQQMAGDAVSSTSAQAFLNAQIALTGAAAALLAAAGQLSTQILEAANALSSTSGSGTLGTGTPLRGDAPAFAVATGNLLTAVQAAGAAVSLVTAAGDLFAQIRFAANAVSSSSGAGTLGPTALAGAAISVATSVGQITALIQFVGQAQANLNALGTLISAPGVSGSAIATSQAQGQLTASIFFSGNAVDISDAAGGFAPVLPKSLADIRMVRAVSDALASQIAPTPYGAYYQRVGEQLWYAIAWDDWLANRWQPRTQVGPGSAVRANGVQFTVAQAGMTGDSEPNWVPVVGMSLLDGSVIWTCEVIDHASLEGDVDSSAWVADTDITLFNGGLQGETALVFVDTTHAVGGLDYDLLCSVRVTDGQQKVGKIRVKVR